MYHNNKYILTEGKHWPEDYVKTAIKLIKQSNLGKQSWYIDNYIKQDVNTFINEFTPLSHKNSNLGFFMPMIRWFIEYSGSSKEKYQEFIERKLDKIISGLLKIRANKEYDSMAEQIKKMSFDQFMKLVDEINTKTTTSINVAKTNATYEVISIYSYEELNKRYGGRSTGYRGQSEWCHANGQSTYESWTKDGTQMFFVIQRKDWKQIKAPNVPYNGKPLQYPDFNCYDEYGMSLIAILVDVRTNDLLNSTSRWNHVVLPISGAADTMFENWQQLNKAIGIDVEQICKDKCKELRSKIEKMADNANLKCEQILKNTKIITDATIPDEIKRYVTEIDVPDSIKNIESWAFYGYENLKSINIPNLVENIEDYAFYECNSLISITLPDSLENIKAYAFAWCESLKSISIPDSVKNIGSFAFEGCKSLKSINIPDSVKNIGDDVFIGCTNLKLLTFEGKTIDQVKSMLYYPWGIKDESIIKCI